DASQLAFENTSTLNAVDAANDPRWSLIVVVVLPVVTDVIDGAGCEWLPPFASSIPSPPFEKIALRSNVSPFVGSVPSTRTPWAVLNAIVFAADALVPPRVLPLAPPLNSM